MESDYFRTSLFPRQEGQHTEVPQLILSPSPIQKFPPEIPENFRDVPRIIHSSNIPPVRTGKDFCIENPSVFGLMPLEKRGSLQLRREFTGPKDSLSLNPDEHLRNRPRLQLRDSVHCIDDRGSFGVQASVHTTKGHASGRRSRPLGMGCHARYRSG